MTVRLGFAVAAHLEPEILVVDEVLAVGDAEFQKKAIGKMQDVSKNEGRTVLFVSHNMQAVSTLTQTLLVLDIGGILFKGNTQTGIDFYLKDKTKKENYYHIGIPEVPKIVEVEIFTSHDSFLHEYGKSLQIRFKIYSPYAIPSPALSFQIVNSNDVPVLHILNLYEEIRFCYEEGFFELISNFPSLKLYPDSYYLIVHFADKSFKTKFETLNCICKFEVVNMNQLRDYYWYPKHAIYIEDNYWNIKKIEN